MSAATILDPVIQEAHATMGQNGRTFQWGTFKFNGTDASDTLEVHMRVVESVILTPAAVPATDETVYCPDLSTGPLTVPAGGTVNVSRTGAAKTANLPCSYLIIGY